MPYHEDIQRNRIQQDGNKPNVNPFATNILTIVAAGSSITGFVNGVQVISVTDPTFSQGRISLFSIPNGCSASGCSAVTSNFDNVVAIST